MYQSDQSKPLIYMGPLKSRSFTKLRPLQSSWMSCCLTPHTPSDVLYTIKFPTTTSLLLLTQGHCKRFAWMCYRLKRSRTFSIAYWCLDRNERELSKIVQEQKGNGPSGSYSDYGETETRESIKESRICHYKAAVCRQKLCSAICTLQRT